MHRSSQSFYVWNNLLSCLFRVGEIADYFTFYGHTLNGTERIILKTSFFFVRHKQQRNKKLIFNLIQLQAHKTLDSYSNNAVVMVFIIHKNQVCPDETDKMPIYFNRWSKCFDKISHCSVPGIIMFLFKKKFVCGPYTEEQAEIRICYLHLYLLTSRAVRATSGYMCKL